MVKRLGGEKEIEASYCWGESTWIAAVVELYLKYDWERHVSSK